VYNGFGAQRTVSVAVQTTDCVLEYAAGSRIPAERTPTGTMRDLYGEKWLGTERDEALLHVRVAPWLPVRKKYSYSQP
jgi:hypothetical protein